MSIAHYSRIVTNWLHVKIGGQRIGINAPVLYPARSPDLAIFYFYLKGRLKQIVYRDNLPNNVKELKIEDAVALLSIEKIKKKGFRFRVELCANVGGVSIY